MIFTCNLAYLVVLHVHLMLIRQLLEINLFLTQAVTVSQILVDLETVEFELPSQYNIRTRYLKPGESMNEFSGETFPDFNRNEHYWKGIHTTQIHKFFSLQVSFVLHLHTKNCFKQILCHVGYICLKALTISE
jgi:hypothetical protein